MREEKSGWPASSPIMLPLYPSKGSPHKELDTASTYGKLRKN